MDENGYGGQHAALEARVQDLRGNYQELRNDMDMRFTKLGDDLTRQADYTNARLGKIVTAIDNKKNGEDSNRYNWVFGVVITLAVAIIGGFIKYDHETITEKFTQQNAALTDKILQQGATLSAAITQQDAALD